MPAVPENAARRSQAALMTSSSQAWKRPKSPSAGARSLISHLQPGQKIVPGGKVTAQVGRFARRCGSRGAQGSGRRHRPRRRLAGHPHGHRQEPARLQLRGGLRSPAVPVWHAACSPPATMMTHSTSGRPRHRTVPPCVSTTTPSAPSMSARSTSRSTVPRKSSTGPACPMTRPSQNLGRFPNGTKGPCSRPVSRAR